MCQLDIFADSEAVQRANGLIAALAKLDRAESRQALRRLAEADPHHAELPRYQILCDFVDHWVGCCNDPCWPCAPADVAAEEKLIRERIIPAAIVMGNAGADLARKCWAFLAKASEGAGIDPEHSDYFAAELYLRAQQFQDAVRAAKMVSGAEMRATAQRWLGLGYYGCGETEPARIAALRYAWLAPQEFPRFADETRAARAYRTPLLLG
ncbi:MAG: hypothetical protein HZC43_04155 [Nitrosomonadales bacterium]|nr:hypothetical protein [Nitrosomonadales bacterium]